MPAKVNFKYGSQTQVMELTYVLAMGKLSDAYGIDVLSVISDGGQTLQKIMLDDHLMIKVWYYFVKEATGDEFEDALAILDQTEGGIESFREAFLKLVVAFTGCQGRKILAAMIEQAKKNLTNSKEIRSMLSSSNSLDEQGSTLEDTPSEN